MSDLIAIERITLYSRWIGFADPASKTEKWTATRHHHDFVWRTKPEERTGTISFKQLEPLIAALERSAIPELDPTLFDLPPGGIERHYGSMWTRAVPELVYRVRRWREPPAIEDIGRLRDRLTR